MSCVMENEESLEEKDKKIEANKFYEKDQRIDVNKFFDDLKRSDSWESTEESNEGKKLLALLGSYFVDLVPVWGQNQIQHPV